MSSKRSGINGLTGRKKQLELSIICVSSPSTVPQPLPQPPANASTLPWQFPARVKGGAEPSENNIRPGLVSEWPKRTESGTS